MTHITETWNVRHMNQDKFETVKNEVKCLNIACYKVFYLGNDKYRQNAQSGYIIQCLTE